MLLALDFDGVLTTSAEAGGKPIDAALAERVAALPANINWLSMNTAAARLPGMAPASMAEFMSYPMRTWLAGDASWWKLAVMQAAVKDDEPFVWVDDLLARCPAAFDWAASLPQPNLLVAPDPEVGLTATDLDHVESFLLTHATFWHGGPIGRDVGDYLLPPVESGVDINRWMVGPKRFDAAPARVYVTRHRAWALGYAKTSIAQGRGAQALYRVQPDGDLAVDVWGGAGAYTCARARVVEVTALDDMSLTEFFGG